MPKNQEHLEELAKKYLRDNPDLDSHFLDAKKVVGEWQRRLAAQLAPGMRLPDYIGSDLHVLRLGEITIVGLAGEIMAEIGLAIRKQLGEKIFVAGYANGEIAYISTRQALLDGGYEPMSFLMSERPAPFDLNMGDDLVKAVVEKTRSLAG
jgi:hypothetical protein